MELPIAAGVADEFALPTEPTSPSPAYRAYMEAHWPQPPTRRFDAQGSDLTLIHSFGGWLGPVCGARLEIRLAAGSEYLTYNDSLRLSLVGGTDLDRAFHYWSTIANIIGSYPDDWAPGDTATLVLDLADLPTSGHAWSRNLLPDLADGELEIAVEDDTVVDYAILYLCFCPVSTEPMTWGRLKAQYSERSD